MDDHIIDAIREKVELCFFVLLLDIENGRIEEGADIREDMNYQGAKVLIKAHNDLVKLYYVPEFFDQYSMGTVAQEWKWYCERNKK